MVGDTGAGTEHRVKEKRVLEGKAETSNLSWFEEFPSVSGEKGQEMLWKEQKGRLGFTGPAVCLTRNTLRKQNWV